MGNMYEKIEALCAQKGIKPGRVCAETGISRGVLPDLKMGRTKTLSAKNTKIISDYFGVSAAYLLDQDGSPELTEEKEKTPAVSGEGNRFDYVISKWSQMSPEQRGLVEAYIEGLLASGSLDPAGRD